MRKRVCGIGLVLVSGCATGPSGLPPGVSFEVQADAYTRSDTIEVRFENNSRTTLRLGVPTCDVGLDTRADDAWTPVERRRPATGCDLGLYAYPPGAAFTDTQPIRDWMPAGEYRFRLRVGWDSEGDDRTHLLASKAFQILAE